MTDLVIEAAVEGDLDEAVLRRTARHVNIDVGNVYGRQGKPHLEANIRGYNAAAQHWPWAVLVDLDSDACPAELRSRWLESEAPFMCLRVAVHQVEAWLLADTANMASLLGVRRALLPGDPDSVPNAKLVVVNLAERSNRRRIRDALVPTSGSKRQVGQLYNPVLRAFVQESWRPEVAANQSESLRRSVTALESLRRRWTGALQR